MSGHTSLRTILPLALITASSMLATDLFLPALPALQRSLGLTVAEGQATVTVFLAGLAGSQLLWGEALHRFGPRACVRAGLAALVLTSFACAWADGAPALLLLRLLQGIAAGAAPVVAPSVIRTGLPERDGVRGIAAISMIEAIVPAAGPVLGTLLLMASVDWRWTFVLVGAFALLAAPWALRATPAQLPDAHADEDDAVGYLALLRDRRFLRLVMAHALAFGALIAFVSSAPQAFLRLADGEPAWFAVSQTAGVIAFIAAASQSGRLTQRLGIARMVRLGAALHLALCVGFLLAMLAGGLPVAALVGFWAAFCGVLGLRGPAAFGDALSVSHGQIGRASAAMMLVLLLIAAGCTQLAAVFLDEHGFTAVAAVMAAATAASALLVWRYPAPAGRSASLIAPPG